jgi:hypothetical protein
MVKICGFECPSFASEELIAGYENGRMGDSMKFVEWADDHRHYLASRSEIERH